MDVRILCATLALAAGPAAAQTAAEAADNPASIDAKSLTAPMAAVQRDSVGPVELVLRLSNDKGQPMTVGLPALVETSRKQGGVTVQADPSGSRPRIVCGSTDHAKAPVTLAAGAQCQARLTLHVDRPGEYRARVAITDASGETALADATANVRACVWWVVFVGLAGTAIGWFLKHWVAVSRPRLVLLERLYRTMAAWRAIDAEARKLDLSAIPADVGFRLEELRQPGALSEKNDAELDNLATRIRRFGSWIRLEAEIEHRRKVDVPAVRAAAGHVRNALSTPVSPTDDKNADDKIVAALKALDAAIEAAEPPQDAARTRRASAFVPTAMVSEATTTAKSASFWRKWGDVAVALVTGVLIAASAIELVWLPNPAWGGLGDMLKLFFGAVAAQAGALAAVDAFRGKFPTT